MTKQKLEQEIKSLRGQMVRLEKECQKREDRLSKLLEDYAIYLSKLSTPEWRDQLKQALEDMDDD